MKRTVSLFIYIVAAICAMAQTKKGPEFPGGEEMLRQFLKDNAQGKFRSGLIFIFAQLDQDTGGQFP